MSRQFQVWESKKGKKPKIGEISNDVRSRTLHLFGGNR